MAACVEHIQAVSLAADTRSQASDDADLPERRLHGAERSYADARLAAWGKWIEDHSDFQGYAPSTAIVACLEGRGGGVAGHRILCQDPPGWWWRTNQRVLLMPEHEREAVCAHYIVQLKEGGGFWTGQEKAEKLGVSYATFRKRISRGRMRYLGIVPPSGE
jgi:hypothetical protein